MLEVIYEWAYQEIWEVSNCEARVRASMLSNLATSLAGTS